MASAVRLAGSGERPQGLRLVGVRVERPETMTVGAGELGQDEGVEGVGFAAGGPEARTGGLHLVGMDRGHRQARLQQALSRRWAFLRAPQSEARSAHFGPVAPLSGQWSKGRLPYER